MALQMKLESSFFVRRKNEKEYRFMMPGETKNLFRGNAETGAFTINHIKLRSSKRSAVVYLGQ